MEVFHSIGAFLLDTVETIVVAAAIFVVVYLFLVQPHQVRGGSMLPNYHNGEYILTDKVTYRFREPGRGDVIVFEAPKAPEFDYIKRIVGLPGEKIKVEDGKVFIYNSEHSSGIEIEEPYAEKPTPSGSFAREGETIQVPKDQYFVMGDNRGASSDSREWGYVKKNEIRGRVWFRYWPPSVFGFIKGVNYSP